MVNPNRGAPPMIAPPTGRPAGPPAAPVFATTGNARADSVLATLDATIAPFRTAPPPEQGAAGWVAQGLGAALGVVNAPMMFIDAAASQGVSAILDALGLAGLFPPMPVATIGLSLHLGTPHTHVHPPSLVPPAPPIPLPSMGVAFLAGSASVLVGGVPALRAGDIGIGFTCGSLAPPFEIMTGASGVYFAGARVARFGMDITFHCNPASPMGGFAVGMGVAGVVAGAAGALAQASAGNAAAAAAQGIQAGLDAAAMAVSMLRGKDPAGPPGIGMLLGPPMGNVMAGGPPIPNIGAMAQGKIYSALGRALRSMSSRLRRRSPPPDANGKTCDGGEPVHVVSGANFNTYLDFASLLGGFAWTRFASSADHANRGVLGWGWSHVFEARLFVQLHRVTFVGYQGESIVFPRFAGADEVVSQGYTLRRLSADRYVVGHRRLGTLEFERIDRTATVCRLALVRGEEITIELRYDGHRRLGSIVERRTVRGPESATYALRYDDEGQLAEITGSRFGESAAVLVRYRHDRTGQLVRAEDPGGAADAYVYDGTHRMIRGTDRIGYTFVWEYDHEGRCVRTQGEDGLWYAAFEYQPDKQATRMTIHDGSAYTFHYDEDGVITKVIGPCGSEKLRIRGDDGRVLTETDSGGRRIDFVYDGAGGLVARRNRFGHQFPPSLEASGMPAMVQRTLPTDARGFYFGGAVASGPGDAVVERRHDRRGNVIFERETSGAEQRWSFDACGNEVAHVDRDGRTHRKKIVRWGLVGAHIDPVGNATRYEHTQHQKISRIVDGGGSESSYVYDSHDRVIEVHRHGRRHTCYAWDRGHRLVESADGDGRWLLRFTPHANGLVGRVDRSDGGLAEFDYDRNGRAIRADTADHHVERSFTPFEEIERESCDGRTVAHRYGWRGEHDTTIGDRFVSSRHRHGNTLVFVDPTGRRRTVTHEADGSVQIDHGNGTFESQQYDAKGRMLARSCRRATGGTERIWWGVRHQYTREGDLVATLDTVRGSTRYAVDEAHRLIGVHHADGSALQYRYDAAGNLVELPSTGSLRLDSGNRLKVAATEQFEYDARNRLASRLGIAGARVAYIYDAEDQLVRVEDRAAEPWTATYDGLGRRVGYGRGDQRTRLWWDGDRVAAREGADRSFRVFLYADARSLVPLGFVDYAGVDASPESGRSYSVFCDQVGLPQHIEDARGEVVWWADGATPHGEVLVRPGNLVEYELRFPGHVYDADLRLHYNRFRDYDPRLGRYLQADPIGVRGGTNLYAYPPNPLVAVDVLGLTPHDNPENGPAHGEDGEGRPRTEDPNATPEGDPPMSREAAFDKAIDAADAHRLKVMDEYRRGVLEGFEFDAAGGGRPPEKAPACVAAVVDRRRPDAKPFVSHNEPASAIADPDSFHPLLQDRVRQQQQQRADGQDHFSQPGTHAEARALDKALKAREAAGMPVTEADLGDFVQLPMWSREDGAGRHMQPGTEAPCCGHCRPITQGTDNMSGNAQRMQRISTDPEKWARVDD